MKDVIITGKKIKKELIILLISFVAAFLLNIYAISKYETDWAEMLGQLHVVLAIALIIYLIVVVLRLIIVGLNRITKKE